MHSFFLKIAIFGIFWQFDNFLTYNNLSQYTVYIYIYNNYIIIIKSFSSNL